MNYKIEALGYFTIFKFEKEILKQKRQLATEFEIEESNIFLCRNSYNIGVSLNGITFACYIVAYLIKKEEKIVAYLEGHLSNAGEYMDISVNIVKLKL